jgi:hypothetical protein
MLTFRSLAFQVLRTAESAPVAALEQQTSTSSLVRLQPLGREAEAVLENELLIV